MQLTSAHNPLLKTIRRAAMAGRPTDDGLVVVEGPRLLAEVLRSQWRIEQVLVTPAGRMRYADLLREVRCEILEVSARAFASTASTESTQEVLALLRPRVWTWDDLKNEPALVVVLDGIQDPGNAGTIVRSGEAFGATGLVFLNGCARVANGKLLRATAGSIFRVPFLEGVSAGELIGHMQASKIKLYALVQTAIETLPETDLREGCAVAVGGEGAGISAAILADAQPVRIPTKNVESLNAGIACSIALFLVERQRNAS
jgi:RNA methyltransferase, TrmH family